jgi:hypothetical protein
MKHIPKDTSVSCIDFSKNYAMKVQNEIHDMHWFSFQIIILVHIMYHHNPNYDPIIKSPKILKEGPLEENWVFVTNQFATSCDYLFATIVDYIYNYFLHLVLLATTL